MLFPRIGKRPIAVRTLGGGGKRPRHVAAAILLLLMDIASFTAAVLLYLNGTLPLAILLILALTLPIFSVFPALILYRYHNINPEIQVYEDGIILPYYRALNYGRSFIRFSDIKRFYVSQERIITDGIFKQWSQDLCNDLKSDVVRNVLAEEMDKIASGKLKKDMGTYVVLRDGSVLMSASRSLIGEDIIALMKTKVKVV